MSKLSDSLRKAFNAYTEINPTEDKEALFKIKEEYWELAAKVDTLEEANRDLKEQVRELEAQLATFKKIELINNAYFTYDDEGKRVGPICYNCYMNNGGVFLLEQCNGGARCSVCKARFVEVETPHIGYQQRIGLA